MDFFFTKWHSMTKIIMFKSLRKILCWPSNLREKQYIIYDSKYLERKCLFLYWRGRSAIFNWDFIYEFLDKEQRQSAYLEFLYYLEMVWIFFSSNGCHLYISYFTFLHRVLPVTRTRLSVCGFLVTLTSLFSFLEMFLRPK